MSILNTNGITKENFFSEGVKLFNEKNILSPNLNLNRILFLTQKVSILTFI